MILISHFHSTFSLETFGYWFFKVYFMAKRKFESIPHLHLFVIFKRQDKKFYSFQKKKNIYFFNFGISKSLRLLILLPLHLFLKYGFLISFISRVYPLSLFKISNMQHLIQKVNHATLVRPDVSFKSQFKFWMQKLEFRVFFSLCI